MKTPLVFSLLCLALAAARGESGAARITVEFPNWQHYSDIRDRGDDPTQKGERATLEALKRSLEFDARSDVPDGDHLTVVFSDLRLAGDFEPWRGPFWDGIRVVKSLYPPMYKFTWQLAGPSGRILRQGSVDTTDENFQMDPALDLDDPLRFEKDFLRNWMNQNIRR